ncbi:PaaX family transcriptional regulator C-terminal domain-containing protein [Nocardioides sp.]|uniref:PaaX family transcriptional regulator n=1 Tax=Nocardioides sp. TaxID=35761 RepID=UPI002ED1E816
MTTASPPAPQSPRALIVTLFGLYVRELGGWISVSRLIDLMGHVGIEPPPVRSSVSRLKKRGVLVSERRGGVAGYALSEYGESVLAEGDRRIFVREEPQESDWVLAVFSVPESQRGQRHALRSRLSRLGFATIASGTWIAPAHVADEARLVLARDGLEHYVELFHADHLGFGDVRALASEWWDLAGIDARYREFVTTYEPLLARWRTRARPGERTEEAFADYVRVLTTWRQLPYLDPGLPPALLPADWSGAAAADLFAELQRTLEGLAHEYVSAATHGTA